MRASRVGHIYVVLLEGGVIKTGKTKHPKSRISKSGFGNRTIIDYWVSQEIVGYSEAEREMLRFLGDVGEPAFGKEYFHGVDFSVAVERAVECSLPRIAIPPKSIRELEIKEAEDAAEGVIGKLSSNNCKDKEWCEHVASFASSAKVIARIVKNRGISLGWLEPCPSIGLMSLFEFALVLLSYRHHGEPEDYLAEVGIMAASASALDDDGFIGWFRGLEAQMEASIRERILKQ